MVNNLKESKVAMLDLETTGLSVDKDLIVEIAILLYDFKEGKTIETLHHYVNPCVHIPDVTSKVHDVYDKDILKAPTFEEICGDVLDILSKADFCCAYNGIRFDYPLLYNEICRNYLGELPKSLDRTWIDPLLIFRHKSFEQVFGEAKSMRLVDIASVLGIENKKAHNAFEDTVAMTKLVVACVNDGIIPNDVKEIYKLQSGV